MHHIVIDQMQRKVNVPIQPTRIISLVPSQTEFLFFLGLDNEVVVITKFCVHPSSAKGRKLSSFDNEVSHISHLMFEVEFRNVQAGQDKSDIFKLIIHDAFLTF